jgi:hypothetical protein
MDSKIYIKSLFIIHSLNYGLEWNTMFKALLSDSEKL